MDLWAEQSKILEKQITQRLTALPSEELVLPGGIGLGFLVTGIIFSDCTL
jgi:hypothetical protein